MIAKNNLVKKLNMALIKEENTIWVHTQSKKKIETELKKALKD